MPIIAMHISAGTTHRFGAFFANALGCESRSARYRRMPIFASSDGWKKSGPILNQLVAPWDVCPLASTTTSSASATASTGTVAPLKNLNDTRAATAMHARPKTANITWRLTRYHGSKFIDLVSAAFA